MALGLGSAAAAKADKVLLLGPSVYNGATSVEAQQAAAQGFGVDVVDAATWASMTTAQFAAYRAIVIGDDNNHYTDNAPIIAAENNASVWGAAVRGNVILAGADAERHAPGNVGAVKFINKGIGFAAGSPNQTGAYIAWANYYRNGFTGGVNTPAKVLDAFGPGAFTVTTADVNKIHIDPATATMPGPSSLSDSDLSGWANTAHSYASRFPSSFKVWAISIDPSGTYTTSDGKKGFPSFLVRGALPPVVSGPPPACVVPKLKGLKLRRVRKRLKANECRLGKVKGPRRGRVEKQRPMPGTFLPPGGKVKVKLGFEDGP